MSLLVRLFFVVAVALVPVVLIGVVDGIEHRRATEAALDGGAERLATVAGEQESRVLAIVGRYLKGIVLSREADAPGCAAVLDRARQPYSGVAYLAVIARGGEFVCGVGIDAAIAAIATTPFFRRTLDSAAFTIGDFAAAPGGGALQVAAPFPDGAAVLVAGLRLDQVAGMTPAGILPKGAFLVVADSQGTVLASVPAGWLAPGSRLPPSDRARIHGSKPGSVEGKSADGVDRIFGYVPVEAEPGGSGLFVETGLDRAAAYAGIDAEARLQILALNGALALGLGMAFFCGRRFITRPAARLVAAAERWRDGDWSARTRLDDPDSEFGRLSTAFDTMADAVSDRERRLGAALIAVAAANAGKEQFLSSLGHELRTPLNPIVGFAEMMQAELNGPLPAPYDDYACRIARCGAELLTIVDGMLDLSHAAAGQLALDEADIDPVALAESALRKATPEAERAGLTLALDAEPGLPLLRCDEAKLREMLKQLLGNALRFTPAGGRITVTLARRAGELAIAVRDTGAGIAAEHLPRVMEPLFRAQDAYIRGSEGVGLGLALVKAMAELHGGRLALKSALGQGTEATIAFPAARSILPAASAAA